MPNKNINPGKKVHVIKADRVPFCRLCTRYVHKY